MSLGETQQTPRRARDVGVRRGRQAGTKLAWRGLTPLQADIIEQLAAGRTRKEIAAARGVSSRAVTEVISYACRATGARTAEQLVAQFCLTTMRK